MTTFLHVIGALILVVAFLLAFICLCGAILVIVSFFLEARDDQQREDEIRAANSEALSRTGQDY